MSACRNADFAGAQSSLAEVRSGFGYICDKVTSRTSLRTIRAWLTQDGYGHVDARAVRAAAVKGCLVWTSSHLVTTDVSRISAVPQCWSEVQS